MTEIKYIGTNTINSGLVKRLNGHSQLAFNSLTLPTLSKADIFNAIANNLGVNYKTIESRYYDNTFNHKSGLEIIRDESVMERLNASVAVGPHEGNQPAIPTSELIEKIWRDQQLSDKIAETIETTNRTLDTEKMFYNLKQALYYMNAGDNWNAIPKILVVMEMVDKDK